MKNPNGMMPSSTRSGKPSPVGRWKRFAKCIPIFIISLAGGCPGTVAPTTPTGQPSAEGVIGSSGGTLTIVNTGTTVDGVVLTVPPGALSSEANLSVARAPDSSAPPQQLSDATLLGAPVRVTIQNGALTSPVFLTLPVSSTNLSTGRSIAVVSKHEDGTVSVHPVFSFDAEAATVKIQSGHFSDFFVLDMGPILNVFSYDTGFTIDDGFAVENSRLDFPSLATRGWYCLSFVTYSAWHFAFRKTEDGALRNRYTLDAQLGIIPEVDEAIRGLPGSIVTSIAWLVSIGAQASTGLTPLETIVTGLPSGFVSSHDADDSALAAIVAAMRITGQPQILSFFVFTANEGEFIFGGHAVLAVGFAPPNHLIIYDGNRSDSLHQLDVPVLFGSILNYEGYDAFLPTPIFGVPYLHTLSFEAIDSRFSGGPSPSDSDGDGTPDSQDSCPDDPSKTEPGLCGCGVPDTDDEYCVVDDPYFPPSHAPVADAGPDQTVVVDNCNGIVAVPVDFDASGSYDPDNNSICFSCGLSYAWSILVDNIESEFNCAGGVCEPSFQGTLFLDPSVVSSVTLRLTVLSDGAQATDSFVLTLAHGSACDDSDGAVTNVAMQGTAFVPKEVTIKVGESVRWTNLDSIIHTTTSGDPDDGNMGAIWDSGDLSGGESFVWPFDEAGEFEYFCIPHANVQAMRHAKVIVQP